MSSSSDSAPPQQSTSLVTVTDDHLATQSRISPSPQDSPHSTQNLSETRPFIMYSRSQLLFLYKSPLVHLPDGMPALKDWFGTENEQASSKKDSETSLPVGNTRDRRFRRDIDDGGSARQSFRGATVTQPSQMGNFKHQSIRAADRDRDRDAEKEFDRERVKEGQERLRNLSDKYDRDRRALSSISQIRPKDRELAPHLANPSSRLTAQGHQTASSRSSDSRDAQRKKDGESNEDWRRATDQPRTGRDRPENSRRDRDDREQPRSRARDTSRSRREGSPSRRDKEDRRVDRDDGYGYRKDRDDHDRDFERDSELEDPRRWRDDGKRDERMAARRERDIRERDREMRDRRDRPAWDGSDRADRRWATGDDRDGRGKKPSGKDRKLGEDGKDRDDRKDREREKEPAWMDTYIPSNDIIGSHRSGGELDGIQAFRKEMQEKDKSNLPVASNLLVSQTQASSPVQAPESQLDEIQLFRLMMKREEQKKKSDSPTVHPVVHSVESTPSGRHHDDASQARVSPEIGTNLVLTTPSSEVASHVSSTEEQQEASMIFGVTTDASTPIASTSSPQTSASLACSSQESGSSDKLNQQNSRPLSTAPSSDPSVMVKSSTDFVIPANQVSQSHPPGGSRLLALGNRNPQSAAIASMRSNSSRSPVSFVQKNGSIGVNAVGVVASASQSIELSSRFTSVADSSRPNNGFSPFDEYRDVLALPNSSASEAVSRGPLPLPGDHTIFPTDQILATEPGVGGFSNNHTVQAFEPVGSGIAAAKGSRFAKFFDGKSRDNQSVPFAKGPIGATGLSQPIPQKADPATLQPHNADARAMEDIFAMLSNSAQAQRLSATPEMSNLDTGYVSPSTNLHALQNAQSQLHLLGPGRMDSVYDDRSFVPDGMVPGLRSAPPPRSRQNNVFSDFSDEPMQFNNGQRGPSQLYQGSVPSIHMQHGQNGPISMQTTQFRGAPSPNHLASIQRLPPGLANLGGRPPHEPSQFAVGMANSSVHGTVLGNAPQPPFNNFQQPSLGFTSGSQIRGPLPGSHQLPGPNALQGLVHPNNFGSTQAQLLGLAGVNGLHGGLRGPSGRFGQQVPQAQPHIALRQPQQPQQQIPPHMLPLHLQQQGFGGGATNQPAHDLMALLMNGARRD